MSETWLAIDSATDCGSVAAGVPPASTASAELEGARRHGSDIVPVIDQVLRRVGVRPGELAGIVVSDGPGGFTGLRIAWAVAKGLAQQWETPLRAVPALAAAAAGTAARVGPGPVGVCFDALRGQVFGAVYDVNAVALRVIVPPTLTTVAELAAQSPVRPRAVAGDGALRYADAVVAWCGTAPVSLAMLPPGAASLLGLVEIAGLGRTIDATSEPEYGRLAEAQVRWEAKYGRALPDSTSHSG